MTDLSTANLKRLLNEATPGPWKFDEKQEWEHVAGPEYPPMLICNEHVVEDCDGKQLFGNFNYTLEDHPGNLQLAALAPALAQEVIRLREELLELRDHLKKKSEHYGKVELSTDPLDGIQLEYNYAEDEINRILGGHDG